MCWWGRDGTSWFAQLRLLLWKNWTLKKRRAGATCCELLFPVGAVFILIVIRSLVKIDDVPDLIPIQDKASAAIGVPFMLGSMACGVFFSGKDRFNYGAIAIAAGPNLQGADQSSEVQNLKRAMETAFQGTAQALYYQIPCCLDTNASGDLVPACYLDSGYLYNFVWGHKTPEANMGPTVLTFPSSESMEDYIQQDDYGWEANIQTIMLGVTVDRSTTNPNQWSYSLRVNSSDVPWTGTTLNTLVSNYSRNDFYKYYDSHVLTLQWMVESFILAEAKQSAQLHGEEAVVEQVPHIYKSKEESEAGKDGIKVDINYPLYDVSFVPFPFAAHRQDNFKSYVGQVFGLFLVVAFMWPFSRMVRNMVEEKEKRLSEGMKQMGLRNSMFWMSWVVTYLISFFLITIMVIAVAKASLFKYSDGGLLFAFFFAFCLSLISLGCLVTTFFSRAKTAGTLSPFLLLAMYLPYFSVSDENKAEGVKNLSCLLSPVAFSLGSTQIISFEGVFIGSQWNNSNDMVDNFRLGTSIALMFFDAVLYAFFAWYLEKVWPREFGTHLKWYFLFTPSYWKSCFCRRRRKNRKSTRSHDSFLYGQSDELDSPRHNGNGGLRGINVATASPNRAFSPRAGGGVPNYGTPGNQTPLMEENSDEDEMEPIVDFGPDYEPMPENMRTKVGVKLRGLRKVFKRDGNEVTAVKGLDLNLYQGQCFTLLGHNGAGKTTTISMLTGMLDTSGGRATIFGRDLNEDMDEIRTFMGSCPQHDVLWDDLTVYEHLEFFGKLKGILRRDLHDAVMTAIEEVQLTPKVSVKSSELSGGQRRRLSLAIALIGDSRVVFLDEPTSGVDPFSRRAIWDLITKKKQGRIIVLTTHFMDEADQLGDRIGIMHHGEMKCCGTSLFLKSKYGVGYCMTLVKEPHCDVDGVTRLVQGRVPEATMLSSVGSELSYSLPFKASAVFPELLGALDDNLSKLGLVNYGLSVTTLEEVFIKVAEEQRTNDAEQARALEAKSSSASSSSSSSNGLKENLLPTHADDHGAMDDTDLSRQESSWFTHFRALLKKRYHIQKRDKRALCCQFLVPIILLSLGMGLLRIPPDFDFPTVELNAGINSAYNQPDRIPYNEGLDVSVIGGIHADEGRIEMFPDGGSGTGPYDLYNFSLALLNNRSQYYEARYGAFFGTALDAHQFNASFPDNDVWELTVLTNASAPHGMPTWAAIGHQSMLRNFTNDPTASITATVHPFSWTYRQKSAIQSLNGIFASIVISLAFTFIPASFAVFVVSEREYKNKHLQFISGVSLSSYWIANFVWDLFCFAIPTSISIMIIYFYHNPELIKNFDVLIVSFMAYGVSIIPFTYLCSFMFTSHSTAQNVMIMIYILGGIIMTNTAVALYLVPTTKTVSERYLRHFFRLVPSFCLGDSIFYISVLPFMEGSPTKWDLLVSGYDIIYMLCSSIVYFILTLAVDKLSTIPSFVGLFKKDPPMVVREQEEPEDDDIRAERERLQRSALPPGQDCFTHLTRAIETEGVASAVSKIDTHDPRSDLIRIEGLRKCYPKKTAVRDVYFGVPAGQCFGFLGVNGAGKTTTIKILTGDVTPTQGSAFIGGYDISKYPAQVSRLLGYCPQFDALHENMTARESLYFYGTIRGIPPSKLKRMVAYLIDRLSLTEYADRPVGTYSGGNKRKCFSSSLLLSLPNGGTIKAGDVQVGTQLVGQDMEPVKVINVQRGNDKPMYQIEYTIGGSFASSQIVTGDHLVTLRCGKNPHVAALDHSSSNDYKSLQLSWWDRHTMTLMSRTFNYATMGDLPVEESIEAAGLDEIAIRIPFLLSDAQARDFAFEWLAAMERAKACAPLRVGDLFEIRADHLEEYMNLPNVREYISFPYAPIESPIFVSPRPVDHDSESPAGTSLMSTPAALALSSSPTPISYDPVPKSIDDDDTEGKPMPLADFYRNLRQAQAEQFRDIADSYRRNHNTAIDHELSNDEDEAEDMTDEASNKKVAFKCIRKVKDEEYTAIEIDAAHKRLVLADGVITHNCSVGIALIGNPPVVFLDEPSTGMDPVSRRFMWDFISETMTRRAVILTTHSMEECEALCSRIGILVNGSLKCVGSSQHLKSRFGRGYQIDISTAGNDAAAARVFIMHHFPDAEKLEDYGGKMKFKILHRAAALNQPLSPSAEQQWKLKDIFALIEKHKEETGISEYSVSQTTLEQIFIRFAKRGDVEEFGGKVMSEEEEEEQAAAAAAAQGHDPNLHTPVPLRRGDSFGPEGSNRIMTPSSYGYLPADGIN